VSSGDLVEGGLRPMTSLAAAINDQTGHFRGHAPLAATSLAVGHLGTPSLDVGSEDTPASTRSSPRAWTRGLSHPHTRGHQCQRSNGPDGPQRQNESAAPDGTACGQSTPSDANMTGNDGVEVAAPGPTSDAGWLGRDLMLDFSFDPGSGDPGSDAPGGFDPGGGDIGSDGGDGETP
jgi:hypothetical protein